MNRFLVNDRLKDCCGCRACEQICPKKCIYMDKNEEGFLYPKVDKSACIDCNLCSEVCPIEKGFKNDVNQAAYAAISQDMTSLVKSSSGGVFYLLAKHIVEKGGYVFGAYLNNEFILKHKSISKVEEIEDLLGSKYIQSDTGDTYSKVKELLLQGKTVMYVSVPCQIAGLHLFLRGKEYANLITVDLLCHGVPSNKLFLGYIKYLEKKHGSKVKEFYFRDKEKYGWSITQKYVIEVRGKDKVYYVPAGLSPYFYAFLRGKVLRESCYSCSYTSVDRAGDITLADFWGVKKVLPELDVEKGCSSVLCNTKKGQNLFDNIKHDMKIVELNMDQATTQNINFYEPAVRPAERDTIYQEYANKGFAAIKKQYLKNPSAKRIIVKNLIKRFMK